MPTVFLGSFRRSAFERVGLFDEAYPPHEDYELNERIRSTGGRIIFSPAIRTRYHVRSRLRALGRQYYRYGTGEGTRGARLAEGHPPLSSDGAGSRCGAPRGGGNGADRARAPPCARRRRGLYHGVPSLPASLPAATNPIEVRARIPAAFAVMHVAWGAGFWAGRHRGCMRQGDRRWLPAPSAGREPKRHSPLLAAVLFALWLHPALA